MLPFVCLQGRQSFALALAKLGIGVRKQRNRRGIPLLRSGETGVPLKTRSGPETIVTQYACNERYIVAKHQTANRK